MTQPLDQPDNYPWMPGSERSVLADLGELAVRLGSPVVWSRSGEVIWYETFSHGLATFRFTATGNSTAKPDVDYTLYGGFCLKLTADAASFPQCILDRMFTPTDVGRWGLEVAIAFFDDYDSFWFNFIRFDATNKHQAGIKLDQDASELQYRDDANAWQKITTLPETQFGLGAYHFIKLVADYDDDLYSHVIFQNTRYDLSDYGLYVATNSAGPYNAIEMVFQGRDGETDVARLGLVILTSNEP